MDISIIVPCYNLEQYIKNLLLSFHMLNLENIQYEIIFVLDSCTDKTEEVIQQYMFDMNYKIIKTNVHSCGLARNEGFNNSSGKYIWFIDGDDWIINPEVIQQSLYHLTKENDNLAQLKFVSNLFNREYFSMVWQYIFRRDLIEDIHFTSIQPKEDDEFMLKVFKKHSSKDILYLTVPSYFYNYMRPGSNMYTHLLKTQNSTVKI